MTKEMKQYSSLDMYESVEDILSALIHQLSEAHRSTKASSALLMMSVMTGMLCVIDIAATRKFINCVLDTIEAEGDGADLEIIELQKKLEEASKTIFEAAEKMEAEYYAEEQAIEEATTATIN